MSEPEPVRKPRTLREAAEIVRATFPPEKLEGWSQLPLDDACMQAHFNLGMWIRNEWIHQDPAPLAVRIQETIVLGNADTISGLIVEGIWRILNGEDDLTLKALPDAPMYTCAGYYKRPSE